MGSENPQFTSVLLFLLLTMKVVDSQTPTARGFPTDSMVKDINMNYMKQIMGTTQKMMNASQQMLDSMLNQINPFQTGPGKSPPNQMQIHVSPIPQQIFPQIPIPQIPQMPQVQIPYISFGPDGLPVMRPNVQPIFVPRQQQQPPKTRPSPNIVNVRPNPGPPTQTKTGLRPTSNPYVALRPKFMTSSPYNYGRRNNRFNNRFIQEWYDPFTGRRYRLINGRIYPVNRPHRWQWPKYGTREYWLMANQILNPEFEMPEI